jgi:hypothetical protein
MPSSRPEVTSIVQAIMKDDFRTLATLITSANINSVIDAYQNTPLIVAAKENKANSVDYLMNHVALDLKTLKQGTKAVAAALDSCDGKNPLNRQAIMRILASRVLHDSNGVNEIYILNPVLDLKVEKINQPAFTELFACLMDFQAMTYYSQQQFHQYRRMINVTHAIGTAFDKLNCHTAARQWFNLQAREMNKLLLAQDDFLETLSVDQLITFAPVMKLVVKIYQDQCLDVLNNNGFKIDCGIAYLCAFKLGTLTVINNVKGLSGTDDLLHDALDMVEQPDDKEEYVFTIPAMDKTFLQAYTRTHSRHYHQETISSEKRLSKKLDYLVLLQPALDRKSPEAKHEMTEQKDLMPKLLSEVIINNSISRKEYELEQAGLKYFYGIGCKSDYTAAARYFERAALTHHANSVNKAFNAYLLSIMVHYQAMITSLTAAAHKSSVQRALKNVRFMLPFYVAYFAMPYHVEVFELLFDFINHSKDNTDRLAFINLLQKYIIKLAGQPFEFKEDLTNHIFKKLTESKLLDDNDNFNKIISTLRECIRIGGFSNIFYKKFDLLDQYPVVDKLTKAKRVYSVMKARVDVCMEAVDLRNNDYEINISILDKALANVKLLPALAVNANEEFNLKRYARVYLLWGEANLAEPEKYDGFKQAIELGNEFALHALLRMPPRRDYQISILRGLQNAIHREDHLSIEAVHQYVLNREEFTGPLRELSVLAYQADVHKGGEDGMIKAASKGYIPALLKLTAKQKSLGHMRRTLYLSTLLLAELILNKNSIEKSYHFSEDKLLSIMNSCMLYLCEKANTGYHEYFCLAAWYIDFISAAQTFITQDNSNMKLDVNSLLMYCAKKYDFYSDVRIAMVQCYTINDEEKNVPAMIKPQHEPRFSEFYSVLQKLIDIQKITILHVPPINYPQEFVSDSHAEIEMVAPSLKPVNINRSALFANRIAAIKPLVAAFSPAFEYKT